MKACTKCGETKALSEFHRHGDGQRPDCKVCRIKSVEAYRASNPEKVKERKAAWRKANPDKVKASNAAWYKANSEKVNGIRAVWMAAWQKANPEKVRAKAAAWRAANPDKAKAISAAWAKANPDKLNAKNAKRNASKRKAIPIWADKNKIGIIYAKAREWKMDVDHIIPLQSKIVCGLHTWDNLQLLHSSQNSSKQNLHWPDMPSI